MHVQRVVLNSCEPFFEVVDDEGHPFPLISSYLHHLRAREYSPNTISAYAYDLLHFMTFLALRNMNYRDFTPALSLTFLEYLTLLPRRLSPATINRIFAAVSSYYDYLIVSDHFSERENPLLHVDDLAYLRVADRHRPFMGRASRQRPVRRVVRVKTVQRLPRPLSDDDTTRLLASLKLQRDRAMFFLMLHGGLRPGEVLNLHLEDISYARRRVTIRHRTDHPKGVRTKSRTERVVDLHQPETLQALSDYIMCERPTDTISSHVFVVGGKGARRHEPLGYHALVKLFARHCERLGMRRPGITPHALRHTHATKLWEGGMRELTLQKRLGHASPESTRMYTRVADPIVVAEYRQALG